MLSDDTVWLVTLSLPGLGLSRVGFVRGKDPREAAERALRAAEMLPSVFRREHCRWHERGYRFAVGELRHPLYTGQGHEKAQVFCEALEELT